MSGTAFLGWLFDLALDEFQQGILGIVQNHVDSLLQLSYLVKILPPLVIIIRACDGLFGSIQHLLVNYGLRAFFEYSESCREMRVTLACAMPAMAAFIACCVLPALAFHLACAHRLKH